MQQGGQGLRLEPLLGAISDFLDDQRDMVERVRRDLVRGLKKPGSGRSGLTPRQILRALVLMRLKNWDYRELRERIADGLTLRQFTDFYCAAVPKHDAFQRGFIRLTPQTLKAVNDMVVRAAVELGLEDGAKLRVDTTVVQTDIHHPTDNTLLWDVVRVVTRLVGRLKKAVQKRIRGFQARRRVLEGEQVPNAKKIFSIFEAHTDLIKRGKVQTPLEFGHKVFLAESVQGLITQYEVLEGNPNDEQHVEPSLKCHKKMFGHVPELYSTDRGFFSEKNVKLCERKSVKVVCIPQCGGQKTDERKAYEKSPDFKKGQRFRAGIEGTISVLFRGRGMKRCLAEGRERFELWVG